MKNILSIFVGIVITAAVNAQTTQPNIILVLFDDMNNMVEGYGGHPQTITPNLVELQGKGTTFTNAFCSSPLCAPSRASMMLGKSLEYTDIFLNNPYDCADFRNNFSPGKYVLTLPEHLKESAGYFTYSVGKVFHCDNDFTDYDTITADPCAKNLSWNKYSSIPIDDAVNNAGQANPQGIEEMKWSAIDSSLVSSMTDYSVVDSASNFLNAYATDPSAFCNMPFFMAVGIRKPHSNLYIPEQYFSDFYIDDFYTIPWEYNYNLPINSFPENGIVMPTLTTPEYTDYDALSFMSQKAISIGPHKEFRDWPGTLSPMPIVNDTLTSIERAEILTRAQKANAVMAYLAAIRFADDQVGRLMDSLEAHPEIYDNTVIIITSDHGFALGEKKHWGKGTLHETDIRIPFIIADLRTLSPPKVCNRTVSHLDVFPTINAYAGGPQPTFPGGASYLDGYDLAPLMNNPNLQWERGAITQVKNAIEGFVCFPQNSVRTDRFHFIRWETNNAEGLVGCDDAANNYEYELYELGMNRDVDPEEWYNLAFDSNYAPVIEYLVEQLPGGSLHLQKTLKTTISLTGSVCLYDNDDVIKLRSKLFNVDGVQLTGSGLSAYTFTWTNNHTGDTFIGRNYNFNMTGVPSGTYTANSSIIFYLKITETATGNLVAFDTKTIYINPASAPSASFDLSLSGTTVSIINYTPSGTYTNTSWTLGDGYSTEEYLPGPYTYAGSGTYSIKNSLYYGNKSTCKVNVTESITVLGPPEKLGYADFIIFPNPNDGSFVIDLPFSVKDCSINIYNEAGGLAWKDIFHDVESHISVYTNSLPSGIYIVEISADNYTQKKLVQIQN